MLGQTQQESVGHFKYFGSKTNYALEIKWNIPRESILQQRERSLHQQI
jgi:hypothetical protein